MNENGKMIKWNDNELILGLIEINMNENGKMIRRNDNEL
jgi:hypothetical protein